MAFIIRGTLGGLMFGFMLAFLSIIGLSAWGGAPIAANAQTAIMTLFLILGGTFGNLAGFEAYVNRRHFIFGPSRVL